MNIREQIESKLRHRFQPLHVEVVDESHMHNVPLGAQSHFKVVLVSSQFDGKPLIGRHRAVNRQLAAELSGQVHALALHTLTPEEWYAKGGVAPDSPPCEGGVKA